MTTTSQVQLGRRTTRGTFRRLFGAAAVTALLAGAAAGVAADDPSCFPLHPYAPLAATKGDAAAQADLDLATRMQNGETLSEDDVRGVLAPTLLQRIDLFRAIVQARTGVSVAISSGYRPYAYQQRFYELKQRFDALLKPHGLGKYYAYDAVTGQIAEKPGIPDDVRAANAADLACVNTVQGALGIATYVDKKTHARKMAVNPPDKSKHTVGLAVDFPLNTIAAATGLTSGTLIGIAHQAGLMRPHAKTDAVHFELLPNWRPSKLFDGTYSGDVSGTELFPHADGSPAFTNSYYDSIGLHVVQGAVTVTAGNATALGTGTVLPDGTIMFTYPESRGGFNTFIGKLKHGLLRSGSGTWTGAWGAPFGYLNGSGSGTWTATGGF